MIERIKAIMNHYNLSVNAFALKIGANQVTINQQINGDRKISVDTLLKIINSFDLISTDWLMTGEGQMLKEDPAKKSDQKEDSASITIDRLLSIIESQQRTIENLSKR